MKKNYLFLFIAINLLLLSVVGKADSSANPILATDYIQMDHLVEGMRALETKSIFKGYSFLNGKRVMVVETNDQTRKEQWTAKSKGRSFYDAKSRYLLSNESEMVLTYQTTTAYRVSVIVSTSIYD